jgi:hypothetical protein
LFQSPGIVIQPMTEGLHRKTHRGRQPVRTVIDLQMPALDPRRRRNGGQMPAGRLKRRTAFIKRAANRAIHPGHRKSQSLDAIEVSRRDQFRGRTRRLRADIGGEIAKREVNLMTNRRDDRNTGRRDEPHKRLFVECPQILETAAATTDDQQVKMRTSF